MNEWEGDLLLVAFDSEQIEGFALGQRSGTIHIPLPDASAGSAQRDLPIVSVDLSLMAVRAMASVIEHRATSSGTVLTGERPAFNSYLQTSLDWGTIDDVAVYLQARKGGTSVISGATYGRTFWLEGRREDGLQYELELDADPGRSVYLLRTQHDHPRDDFSLSSDEMGAWIASISQAVSSFAPTSFSQINQCVDGLNNDPQADVHADGCDFSCMPHPDFGTDRFPGVVPVWEYGRPFAVFGDAEWCTHHAENWQDLLHLYGAGAEQMLNWVEAPAEVGGDRVPPFRLAGIYCWIFDDLEAASACHHNGQCPPEAESYPFTNVGWAWSGNGTVNYLDRVWGATDAWASDGIELGAPTLVHPLQNVAVVTAVGPDQILGFPEGLAFLGIEVSFQRAGGAVAAGYSPPGSFVPLGPTLIGRIIAHEFGHTYGLNHEDLVGSFMRAEGGPNPRLSDTPSNVLDFSQVPPDHLTNNEVWAVAASRKESPRPPGFRHVGCAPSSCPTGLTCTSTVQGHACLR